MDILAFMDKQFRQLWIIPSFPIRNPSKCNRLDPADGLLMDIFEMKDIGAIFRDILNMTFNCMFSEASGLQFLLIALHIQKLVLRLFILIYMQP